MDKLENRDGYSLGKSLDAALNRHQEVFVQFVDQNGRESRIYRVPAANAIASPLEK